jgi:hypothetical protein
MAASWRFKQIEKAICLNMDRNERFIYEDSFIEYATATALAGIIANELNVGDSVEFANTIKLSK